MKHCIILSMLLFLTITYAKETETYSIYGKKVAFIFDKNAKIRISQNCLRKKQKKYNCIAFKKIKESTRQGIDQKYFKGGANPGAVICRRKLKGTVVLGYDANKNQNTFCKFKDNSYLSSGTITYHSQKKGHK